MDKAATLVTILATATTKGVEEKTKSSFEFFYNKCDGDFEKFKSCPCKYYNLNPLSEKDGVIDSVDSANLKLVISGKQYSFRHLR